MEGICEDTSRLVVSTMVSIQKSIEFVAKRRMRTRARVNTRTGVDTGVTPVSWCWWGGETLQLPKGDYIKTGNQNLVVNLPKQKHTQQSHFLKAKNGSKKD